MSPILNIQQRYRELGRIRMGEKGSKGQPVGLDHWRLTSSNRALLEEAAGLWGGEVTQWDGAPNEGTWQLTTGTDTLPIIIPPGREPVSQWMEQWTGGGCTHRCDTVRNHITDDPCSCDPENPACKATTRLSVTLPDLPDVGVWRLETHGWNAANELPGTIGLIQSAASRGEFLEGTLRIEHRSSKSGGQTRRFRVPVVDLNVKIRELVSGGPVGQVTAGGGAPRLEAATVDVDAEWEHLLELAGPGKKRALVSALKDAGVGDRSFLSDAAVLREATVVAERIGRPALPAGSGVTDPDVFEADVVVEGQDDLFGDDES